MPRVLAGLNYEFGFCFLSSRVRYGKPFGLEFVQDLLDMQISAEEYQRNKVREFFLVRQLPDISAEERVGGYGGELDWHRLETARMRYLLDQYHKGMRALDAINQSHRGSREEWP